jgi:ribosomal protein S14
MLYLKIKNKKNINNFFKYENFKKIQKYIFTNILSRINLLPKESNYRKNLIYLIYKLKFKKINATKIKINRRCTYTNRNRAVLRKYNMSRSVFCNLNQFGLIPGIKKAIW